MKYSIFFLVGFFIVQTFGFIIDDDINYQNVKSSQSRAPTHREVHRRTKRQGPTYNYEFEKYNDITPPHEAQYKVDTSYEDQRTLSRFESNKCLDFCRKCGSSYKNSYVCTEDAGYHKPPFTFMLFNNKCQMKCYNKCHNTNYKYSTNPLCQKVMSVLESDETSKKHPLRHEKHHIWVNSQKTSADRHF